MDSRNLPYGGAEIVALRKTGKRPADMLLISCIGHLQGERNPTVLAKPERAYDWRFVVGLRILLVVQTDTPGLAGIVRAIELANPATFGVWFADRQNGLNLCIDGFRPQSKALRKMSCTQRANLAGLGSDRPRGECLAAIAGQVRARAVANAGRFDPALIEAAQAGFARIFGKAWGAAA